ncbi:MAG: DUF1844 domain-containing protein [Armatimonadota bacterium]
MAEERDYEIIDKRKVKPDETEASHGASAAEGQQSGQDAQACEAEQMSEEERQRLLKDVLAPDLHVLIMGMVERLADQAWMHMGIVANPATGVVAKDMARAKLAIDCAQALVDRVLPHIPEGVRRELRNLISNLQLNFVRRVVEP